MRPRVDLPQPDSPTRPTVSPLRCLRLTPSTAFDRGDLALEHPTLDRELLDEVADLDEHRLSSSLSPSHTASSAPCGPARPRRAVGSSLRQMSRSFSTRARQRAAKRQPDGQIDERWNDPGDRVEFVDETAEHRNRADQPLRVGVFRFLEDRAYVGLLDDLARVHHGDPVRHLRDDAEVVRDQQDGRVQATSAARG